MDMLRVDSLTSARLIVAQRGFRDEAQVLDACEHLIAYGDWIDQARGHEVRRQIAESGLDALNRAGRRGLMISLALMWALRLAIAAGLGVLAFIMLVDFFR